MFLLAGRSAGNADGWRVSKAPHLLPPTTHAAWTQYGWRSSTVSSQQVSLYLCAVYQMDVLAVPADRWQGWYLSLMAPNVKGSMFAWLDPSRLYCNPQVSQYRVGSRYLKYSSSHFSFAFVSGSCRLCQRSSPAIPRWHHRPGSRDWCYGFHPR